MRMKPSKNKVNEEKSDLSTMMMKIQSEKRQHASLPFTQKKYVSSRKQLSQNGRITLCSMWDFTVLCLIRIGCSSNE